jgi:hypothetical protein
LDSSVHSGILGPPKQNGGSLSGGGGGYGVTSVTWSISSSQSPSPQLKQSSALQRKSSYRGLHEIMTGQSESSSSSSSILPTLNFGIAVENSCKRPLDESMQPATKRAKSDKPRIDYYLRLKVRHIYSCFIPFYAFECCLSSNNNYICMYLLYRQRLIYISPPRNKLKHWRFYGNSNL